MAMKTTMAAAFAAGILISPAAAAPVQWAGNGHWYEYIDATAYDSFADALAAAAALSYLGYQGYLATITSADEQAFLNTVNSSGITAWLGGSDAATEGDWRWVTGPEAGTAFVYSNWAAGEPNDFSGEDGLLGWWTGDTWNDIYDGFSEFGIVVEYSEITPTPEVPLPAALPLLLGAVGATGFLARRRRSATQPS
jgi:hypothetical protein